MKNKLYFFLLTALMGLFGMNASAQDPYEISTAQDLMAFADLVNGGETGTNAVLTADIDMTDLLSMEAWTPIGKDGDHKYTGTFDGQGNSITGFKYTPTEFNETANYSGLFGIVRNATIKNFYIEGTLTVVGGVDSKTYTGTIAGAEASSVISGIHSAVNVNVSGCKAHTGGILGSTITSGNPVLVENCEYSGTLTHSGTGDCQAGILGYTYNGGVKNCIFSGTIIGENNKYGGILGYCKITTFLGVQNCLSIGKIVANEGCTTAAAIIANWNSTANTANVKNNYYCLAEGSTTTIAIGNKAQYCEAPVAVTAEQLASGEVCYLLNGSQSENVAFYQTLLDDEVPTLDSTHDIVYPAGRTHCDGTPYEGETGYSNTPATQDDHNYVDGFCSYCKALDEDYMTANGEGNFEIGTAAQFKWLAAYVNQKDNAANAILTANIDFTDVTWTPIGNGLAYTGTFDGDNHTITNFSLTTSASKAGLFGIVGGGAVVKNFTIEGTINSTGQRNGVIGSADGNATISNIHSKVDLTCTQTRHGGVLGAQSAVCTVNIDRCTYSGTLTVTGNATGNFGGIVGLTQNNASAYVNISNCLFDGVIDDGTGDNAGGIVGYSNATNVTIKNCLSVGEITATNPGQFFGQLNESNSKCEGNNYYVAGNVVGNLKSGKKLNGTTPETTTAEQLASGEVAVNLGTAWRQVLGTDEYPTPNAAKPVIAKITEASYATLYISDTDLTIPTGVEAYTGVILNEGWVHLNAVSEKIAAGEPVILKGNAGYYSFVPTTGATKAAENVLKGAAEDTEAAGKYILAMPEGKAVGFYKAKDGTIKAGKAYLEADSEVKAFFFDGDDATGIEETLSNSPLKGENVYNLAGQRMSKMHKGINIVDGKKILK